MMIVANTFFTFALTGYATNLVFFLRRLIPFAGGAPTGSNSWILYGSFGFHSLALLARAMALNQCPLYSVGDSLSFLAWATVLAALLFRWGYRKTSLEGLVPVLAVVLMGLSTLWGTQSAAPATVPAKAWIALHAALYFLGYAAFGIAFLSSGIYLFVEHQLKARHLSAIAPDLGSLDLLDRINTVALRAGFLCLTLGIATGALVLSQAQEMWVVRDPKIVIALFTWILYALLLFVRSTNRLRGRKVAYLSMLGFAVVFVTFLGVQHMAQVF